MLIWFMVSQVFSDSINGIIKYCGTRLEKDGPQMLWCLAVGPILN